MTLYIVTLIINKIMAPLVEGYLIIMVLSVFSLQKKYKYKYMDLVIIIEIFSCIALMNLLVSSKNVFQLLITSIIILVIIEINYIGSIYKKILSFGLFIGMIFITESVTTIILVNLTGLNASDFFISNYYHSWAVIFSKTFQVILLRCIILITNNKTIHIDNAFRVRNSLLVLLTVIALFITAEIIQVNTIDKEYINKYDEIVLFTVSLVFPIMVIYIFIRILNEVKRQSELKQLLQQYKIEHKYTQELNKVLDNLRILKHDLKNHISCMWGLIETDNIEDFKCYLTNLTKEIEELDESEIAQKFDINKT